MIGHFPIRRNTSVIPLILNNPVGIDYDPLSDRFAIANFGSNNVLIVDGTSFSVLATVTGFVSPGAIRFDPASNRIFVGNDTTPNRGVSIINGVDYSVTHGVFATSRNTIRDFAFDIDNDKIFVSVYGVAGNSNIIDIYTLSTFSLVNSISITTPIGLWLDLINRKLFVAQHSLNAISIIDADTYSILDSIVGVGNLTFQTAYGICKDPSTNTLLVTNNASGSNKISVVDLNTNTIIGQQLGYSLPRFLTFKDNRIYTTLSSSANKVVVSNKFY